MSARGQSARVDIGRRRDARAGQLVAHDRGELHIWARLRWLIGGGGYGTWK